MFFSPDGPIAEMVKDTVQLVGISATFARRTNGKTDRQKDVFTLIDNTVKSTVNDYENSAVCYGWKMLQI